MRIILFMRKYKTSDGYMRVPDNKLRGAYGETDTDKKVIRVNKERHHKNVERYNKNEDGSESLIDTIVHEEDHAKHPRKHEKTVYKDTKKKVDKMSNKEKQRLYKLYS